MSSAARCGRCNRFVRADAELCDQCAGRSAPRAAGGDPPGDPLTAFLTAERADADALLDALLAAEEKNVAEVLALLE